jgi:hypothetical protein
VRRRKSIEQPRGFHCTLNLVDLVLEARIAFGFGAIANEKDRIIAAEKEKHSAPDERAFAGIAEFGAARKKTSEGQPRVTLSQGR